MRCGWTNKEAAPVLGCDEAKVSQAMVPAVRKIAMLARVNWHKTLVMLLAEMDRQEREEALELELQADARDGRGVRGYGFDLARIKPLPRRCAGV